MNSTSKAILATGQATMAICGPVFLAFPAVLLGAGVSLTIGAVALDLTAQNLKNKKLSFNESGHGKLQENINKHYQPLVQNALQDLQKATVNARKESVDYQRIKEEINAKLTSIDDRPGVFELLYFKISSSQLIKDNSSSSKKKLLKEIREILDEKVSEVLSDKDISGLIEEVTSIERKITANKGVTEAHKRILKIAKERNAAMTESSELQSLPLIMNQVLKRIARTSSGKDFTKESVTSAVKLLKKHYSKNGHQVQLHSTLNKYQNLITDSIFNKMKECGMKGKKPKDNLNLFLPTWYSITSKIEDEISKTDITTLNTEGSVDKIIQKLTELKNESDAPSAPKSETKNPMQSLLEQLLEDEDLAYDVTKLIAQEAYNAAGGQKNRELRKLSEIIKKSGTVKYNGKEVMSLSVSKKDIIRLAAKNIDITKAILKFCRQDLKTKYRSEFFNAALDIINEKGVSFGDDAHEDPDDDRLENETTEELTKEEPTQEFHFKGDEIKGKVYKSVEKIIKKEEPNEVGTREAQKIIEDNIKEQEKIANPNQAYRG